MKRIVGMLVIGLVVLALVATAGFLAVGCGGSDKQAKADLSGALTEFGDLQKLSATSTLADLKTGFANLAVIYDKVILTAKKVPGADVTAFATAWKALQDTVAVIPDNATIMTAALQVMPKVQPVVQAEAALKALVTP
jgi:hypothetical protein